MVHGAGLSEESRGQGSRAIDLVQMAQTLGALGIILALAGCGALAHSGVSLCRLFYAEEMRESLRDLATSQVIDVGFEN